MKATFRRLASKAIDVFASAGKINLQPLIDARLGVRQYETPRRSGEQLFLEVIADSIWSKGITGRAVFDIGANEGNYAQLVLESLKQVSLHCFEPNPPTAARLQERFARDDRVVINSCAMGEISGDMEIFDHAEKGGTTHASAFSSVLTEIHGSEDVVRVRVPVVRLDKYCTQNGIDRIFLLKTDTEGGDLAVLRGAGQFLKNGRIALVHFEFNEMNVISRCFLRDFYELMPGYAFFRLRADGLIPLGAYDTRNEIFQYQNILAVQRGLLDSVRPFWVRSVWCRPRYCS